MKLRLHAATDTGRVRRRNEDAFLVDEARGLLAVADGVGGLPGGRESSQAAIARLRTLLAAEPAGARLDLRRMVHDINEAVIEQGRAMREEFNTATTLTVAHLAEGVLRFAHVGDCSVHLFRGPAVRKLTLDHTVATDSPFAELFQSNAEAAAAVRNVLTRCLGATDMPVVDVDEIALAAGDRVLVASDGAFRNLVVEEVAEWMQEEQGPFAVVHRIIDTANLRGAPDNVTAAVAYVDAP